MSVMDHGYNDYEWFSQLVAWGPSSRAFRVDHLEKSGWKFERIFNVSPNTGF
jgi:hypothetical protein